MDAPGGQGHRRGVGEAVAHADAGGGRGGPESPALAEGVPDDRHQGEGDGDRRGEEVESRVGPGVPGQGDEQPGVQRYRDEEEDDGPGAQEGADEDPRVDDVEGVLGLLQGALGDTGRADDVLEALDLCGPSCGPAGARSDARRAVAGQGARRRRGGGASGEFEDLPAQRAQLAGAQVADEDLGVGAAGDLDGELPQADDPPEQRVGDVEALDARQAGDPQLLSEDPRAQVDGVDVDGVGHRAPGQERDREDREDDEAQDDPGADEPGGGVAAGGLGGPGLHGLAVLGGVDLAQLAVELDGMLDVVHRLPGDDGEDGGDDPPPAGERGDGVDVAPVEAGGKTHRALAGALRRPRGRARGTAGAPGAAGPGGPAHRPAILSSPRSARIWRRRSASATGRPLMVASVVALAVWSLTSAMPMRRAMGPWDVSTNCMRP